MRVLILGATGGTGREALQALLDAGHEVTALVRSPLNVESDRLTVMRGDALNAADVDAAVRGQDAVVVTLGIRENPLRVRFRGAGATSSQVRSEGTRLVVAAMQKHDVKKLIVQSSYGVGPSREMLTLKWRLIFSLLLKPQIADTEVQEVVVRESGLDWVLVQPVGLTDTDDERVFTSETNETQSMAVSRRAVGRLLASFVSSPLAGKTIAVSS
ncbi:MAG: SDR family oxidoreductase [Myxococcaceae bacterium]|nr:SDR family oxidoreductase [Myxococcaceae bacterium]